jgi:hypothetical protein
MAILVHNEVSGSPQDSSKGLISTRGGNQYACHLYDTKIQVARLITNQPVGIVLQMPKP